MALRKYRNSAARTLAAPIANPTTTSMTVDSASGFPTQFPYTLIIDPDGTLEEVVDVTAAVGNVLTVVRGVDSTTPAAHAAGVKIVHGVSARDFTEANTHVNQTTGAHGTTGSLVDTDSAQTIVGSKTFTGGLNTAPGVPVVSTQGDQTISGSKTFTTPPLVTSKGAAATTGGDQTFSGANTFTGTVRTSNSVHQDIEVADSTSITGIVNTSFAPGSPVVGASFVAPPSGRVKITVDGFCATTRDGHVTQISFTLRTGATVGAGTVLYAANSDVAVTAGRAVNTGSFAFATGARPKLIVGLTPGAAYNARVEHTVDAGGNGEVYYRSLLIEPKL